MKNKILQWNKTIKWTILILVLVLFIITVAFLIATAFYCVPQSDDYTNGALTYHALRDKGVLAALKVSFIETVKFYFEWEGAYFTDFLMKSVPGFLGYDYYWMSPIIILLSLILSTFYVCRFFLEKCIHMKFDEWCLIPMLFLVLFLNYMPSIAEGLYWNCGAMYYSIMISIEMCFGIQMIKLYYDKKNSKLRMVFCCFLALIVAGGNLVTALNAVICLTTASIYLVIKKSERKNYFIIINILFLMGFIISVIAPGKKIRATGIKNNMSAIPAILLSFPNAAKFMLEHINWAIAGSCIVFGIIMKSIVSKIDFKFKYPFGVIGYSFCIFAASFTPTLYALGGENSGRVLDTIFYEFLIFLFFSEFYMIGFIQKRSFSKYKKMVALVAGILLLSICAVKSIGSISWTREIYKEFADGSLQTYKAEHDERIRLYRTDAKEIEVLPITVNPVTVFHGDIEADPHYWINICIEQFWEKESVKIRYE